MRAANDSSSTAGTIRLVVLSLFLYGITCDGFSTTRVHRTIATPRLATRRSDHGHRHRRRQNPDRHDRAGSFVPSVPSSTTESVDDGGTDGGESLPSSSLLHRRSFAVSAFASLATASTVLSSSPQISYAEEGEGPAAAAAVGAVGAAVEAAETAVEVVLTGDVKKLFNEGRVREEQGNIPAAIRIYQKVTKIAPRFIYGWSNLGNTQVALGDLRTAETSYTAAIDLCRENLREEERFGIPRCNDYYLLLLNRGTLRLNDSDPKRALQDLELSASLRGKPDPLVLQNRARARELNGLYGGADADYSTYISMTSNDVTPIWLRAAMVKFQVGDMIGALDLVRRVETKYPEAPEVRAAVAALLAAKGDEGGARRKLLEIPDRQRMKYVEDREYVREVVAWPPKMIESLNKLTKAIQDSSAAAAIDI